MPEFYFTKLQVAAQVLCGDEKQKAASIQKWESFETLLEIMDLLITCYEDSKDKAKALNEANTAIAVFEAMKAGNDSNMNDGFKQYEERLKAEVKRISSYQ